MTIEALKYFVSRSTIMAFFFVASVENQIKELMSVYIDNFVDSQRWTLALFTTNFIFIKRFFFKGPFHENASRKDRTLRHTNERLMTTEKQKAGLVRTCSFAYE